MNLLYSHRSKAFKDYDFLNSLMGEIFLNYIEYQVIDPIFAIGGKQSST